MPEQVRCPECNAALRVPENLLGRTVKCPKCQTTFTAEAEEPIETEGVVREPSAPPRRSRAQEEYEEEEEQLEEEEEEERPRPRRRRKRRSAAAMDAVAGPALALIVTGAFGIVADIAYAIYQVWSQAQMAKAFPPGQVDPNFELGLRIGKIIVYIIVPLALVWSIVLLVGGLKMKKLQSFGLAVTACILAMLPLNCCCLMGLPLGIWGLVVLNRPDVKNAFS